MSVSTESIFRRLEIQAQYAQLRNPGNRPEGVYLSPVDGVDHFEGVIFVRQGYYQGAVLRFTIAFPVQYPVRAPIVTFAKGSLLHPLIDSRNDRLAIASVFPAWDPSTDSVSRLLFFIKSIFETHTLDKLSEGQSINTEMLRLYRTQPSVFQKLAAQCAIAAGPTSDTLFDQANHAQPMFRKLSEEQMQTTHEAIFGVTRRG